jgi:hypothetical protein
MTNRLEGSEHAAEAISGELKQSHLGNRESRTGYRDDATGTPSKVVETVRGLTSSLAELAVAANTLPPEYRAVAFGEFVRFLLRTQTAPSEGTRMRTHVEALREIDRAVEQGALNEKTVDLERQPSSLERVERALNLVPGALHRVLQIDEDKSIQVLARVEGRSVSERQVRLAQIVCYAREKAFGEMKTDIEILRRVCIAQGQYDSANFAANFRRDGSVIERPTPGSKDRLFMLSREGVESAVALLRQLAGN